MKFKFILFEGIAGSGKTTLAKELAKQIDGYYTTTPVGNIIKIKDLMDHFPSGIRYLYYGLGNFLASFTFRKVLKTSHLVGDRYTYSTAAYHSIIMNKNLKPTNLILQPDLIIYTYAPIDEIDRRLSQRPKRRKYEKKNFLEKVDLKFREYLLGKNVIYVDTSKDSVEKIVKKLINLFTS
jgi:dTMP kinase